jgi:hypothetical protein
MDNNRFFARRVERRQRFDFLVMPAQALSHLAMTYFPLRTGYYYFNVSLFLFFCVLFFFST